MFCPNVKSKRSAQTTSGTFLKNDAMILTILAIHGLAFVVRVPIKLKKNAHIAAHTVTATDTSTVSARYSNISGNRVIARSSGTKFFVIHKKACGIASKPLMMLNSVTREDMRKIARIPMNAIVNVRFLLINIDF